MATSFQLSNIIHAKGWSPSMPLKHNLGVSERLIRGRNPSRQGHRVLNFKTYSFFKVEQMLDANPSPSTDATFYKTSYEAFEANTNYISGLLLADLDPATAKVAIGIIGPFLSAFSFLFILRIVMSWYPKIPLGKFPYVLAYAPTEPFLVPTRKLIPPLAGVDITPVVWVGLMSFLNEILVGPQGLLVLLSQQVSQ